MRLLCFALPLALLSACGGSSGSGVNSGTNTTVTATTTLPDLEGTVSGTTRVVANKSYTYSATAATGMVGDYTVNWGDGSAPFTMAAATATQDKIWRSAGNYTASLARIRADGTVVSGTQAVSVVDHPISAGLKHSCAIMSDNTVSCWGDNSKGQLGIGSLINTNAPSAVTGLTDVVSLIAFGNSTCAAKTDGSVWCWGYGLNATSGLAESVTAPQLKAGVSNAVALAGGNIHACALQRAGTVMCWGSNLQGEMGAGPRNDPSSVGINPKTPQLVLDLSDAVSIAAGGYTTCAIRADTSVWCWGGGVAGQAGPGVHNPSPTSTHISFPVAIPGVTHAVSLAVNYTSSCAVLSDRSVKCWGANTGVTGFALTETATTVASVSNVAAMSLGYSHACVLRSDSSVACWGTYSYAGAPPLQSAPVTIMDAGNAPLTNVLSLSSGLDHSCALKEDGSVFCWGLDDKGQLGDGLNGDRPASAPVLAAGVGAAFTLAASQSLAAGGDHNCALKVNGEVVCWGFNASGQLGIGVSSSIQTSSAIPLLVNISGVKALTAGASHTCALKTNGDVTCWGANSHGQLGAGDYVDKLSPVPVALSGVGALVASGIHTCALKTTGEVWCWGEGFWGQLGNGAFVVSNVPVNTGLSGVQSLSSRANHTCAVKTNGEMLCWGEGWFGKLGNGSNANSSTPVLVALSGVSAASVGAYHSCALKLTGDVYCWGNNSAYGQLGNGSNINSLTPVAASISGVRSLASGYHHTCATQVSGAIACWGWNGDGSLGNGTNTDSNVPVPVSIPGGVSTIAAGGWHTCAIKTDGGVVCWGSGMRGQLGNPAYTASNVPVNVLGITLQAAPLRTFWR